MKIKYVLSYATAIYLILRCWMEEILVAVVDANVNAKNIVDL